MIQLSALDVDAIDAALALDHKTLGGMWTAQGYRQELVRESGISLGLTHSTGELIAMGFIWIIDDEAHVILVAVDPQWRSKGLGSLLLNQLLSQAILQGCIRATLEVNASNRAAIELYRRFQFQKLGQRPNYYGTGQDALIFWLSNIQNSEYQNFLMNTYQSIKFRLAEKNLQVVNTLHIHKTSPAT